MPVVDDCNRSIAAPEFKMGKLMMYETQQK